jgi:hypothetical protein
MPAHSLEFIRQSDSVVRKCFFRLRLWSESDSRSVSLKDSLQLESGRVVGF